MFDAAWRDIDFVEFATYEELRWWSTRSSGGPMVIIMWLLAGPGIARALEPELREFGELLQFADILCDLAEDLPNGRLYLPLEDLDRFAVRAEDIKAGRWTPGMAESSSSRWAGSPTAPNARSGREAATPHPLVDDADGVLRTAVARGAGRWRRSAGSAYRLPFPDLMKVWQPQWRAMIPC